MPLKKKNKGHSNIITMLSLHDKIKMIDELIAENPDSAIRDYIEAINEINNICSASEYEETCISPKNKKFILENYSTMSDKQLSQRLNISLRTIQRLLHQNIKNRKPSWKRERVHLKLQDPFRQV